MRIYDITRTFSEGTPVYPGDPETTISRVSDILSGGAYTLSALSMSSHAGTHIDAPSHLFHDGASVDQIPLDVLIGDAFVASVDAAEEISPCHLDRQSLSLGVERLLLRFREGCFLGEDAARWIVQQGIKLVGVDSISVDQTGSQSLTAHRILLQAGVIIVESLNMESVPDGTYTLICLPLKLDGCDGSPVRAVLIEK